MSKSTLITHSILSLPFGENTYVAHFEGSRECVVIDPGLEPDKVLDYVDGENLAPAAILCTHGHSDHIGGNRALKGRWPQAPLVIGEGDAYKLTDPVGNLSALFGLSLISPTADRTVREGETVSAAGFDFEVLETPGHSRGHVSFLWKGGSPFRLFDGDVLMQGGVGRSDFPDGDHELLVRVIREKLFSLPEDTIVLPGHGPSTTIGREKRSNPFVRM